MKKEIGLVSPVHISSNGKKIRVLAKFDTGARRNSIDKVLARRLGLKYSKELRIKSSLGKEKRGVVYLVIEIKGRKFYTKATLSDRSIMAYPVLIGRNIIHGNFVIDTELSNNSPAERDLNIKY